MSMLVKIQLEITPPMMHDELNSELCKFLESEGILPQGQLPRALSVATAESQRLDRTINALGLLEEDKLLPLLARFQKIDYLADAADIVPDKAAEAALGRDYLQRNGIIPVVTDGQNFALYTSDPTNAALHQEIAFLLERPIKIIAVPTRAIRARFAVAEPTQASHSDEQHAQDAARLRDATTEGPVIKFVNSLLSDAVELGVSDIHFESGEGGLKVRFRIHGILQSQPITGSLNQSSVFARLKVLSGMNVTERRLPQDGRMALTFSGRPLDFRVSSIPTQFGESIVCRVLDPRSLVRGWADLGFDTKTRDWIIGHIERPSGLFLVTGPTGSGKTTTLYTALTHLNSPARKIITIEDPIEYSLSGIEQMQVHSEIGLSFARALRSILRQDPNVIMIGEIRDEETAAMACRAAMVGRMVLSTLHANSADAALARLIDLGVQPYLAKDVLRGVLSQELVPCKNGTGRRLEVGIWEGERASSGGK